MGGMRNAISVSLVYVLIRSAMAIQRRMGGGQTDNNEVDLMDEASFAHRLTTIQVIAERSEVTWGKEDHDGL